VCLICSIARSPSYGALVGLQVTGKKKVGGVCRLKVGGRKESKVRGGTDRVAKREGTHIVQKKAVGGGGQEKRGKGIGKASQSPKDGDFQVGDRSALIGASINDCLAGAKEKNGREKMKRTKDTSCGVKRGVKDEAKVE